MDFDLALFIWSLATFAALFLLLARFVFKPLGLAMQEREKRIKDSVDRAEALQVDASRLIEAQKEELDRAKDDARSIINDAHSMAERMRSEASEKAAKDSEVIVDNARVEIEREVNRSLDELKGTVAGLSVRIARQIIKSEITTNKHEELADELIERLKKTNAKQTNRR